MHAFQKTWAIHSHPVKEDFIAKKYAKIHVFIYASLNYFGYNRRTYKETEFIVPGMKSYLLSPNKFAYISIFVLYRLVLANCYTILP